MAFDFDTPAAQSIAGGLKWSKYAGQDILPMWVADMDFRCPPAVIEALEKRVQDGVFGYGLPTEGLIGAVVDTMEQEFSWKVHPDWLVWLPGLVSGINIACKAVGKPGDGVMVNTPVYPPFLKSPKLMDRVMESVSLSGGNEAGWTLNRRRFEMGLTDKTSLFLLCHPHNPVGRMWKEDELEMMAEVCLDNRVLICSDEIHNQLVLDRNRKHRPLATLGEEVAARTITLLAPSKTFNIPGLGCSLAVIPDETIRRRFVHAGLGIVPHVNVLGLAAAEACWVHGGQWHAELLDYLRGNLEYLKERVAVWPGVTMSEVEATFLAWLDVEALGLDNPVAHFENHGLGLSDGKEFGGPGFVRLNFACPRSILVEACCRLEKAIESS